MATHCFENVHLLHSSHKDGPILFQVLLDDIMPGGCTIAYRLHLQFHLHLPLAPEWIVTRLIDRNVKISR
jgi:hypothetical protein